MPTKTGEERRERIIQLQEYDKKHMYKEVVKVHRASIVAKDAKKGQFQSEGDEDDEQAKESKEKKKQEMKDKRRSGQYKRVDL